MSKETFSIRIDPDLLAKLKLLADKENRSLNNYIETILKEHIK